MLLQRPRFRPVMHTESGAGGLRVSAHFGSGPRLSPRKLKL